MCSTLNLYLFKREKWISVKQRLRNINCDVFHSEFHTSAVIDSCNYCPAAWLLGIGRQIPRNNIRGDAVVVCLLCQLPLGGQIDIIQSSGGVECVNHPPPPSLVSTSTCAQWGHTKVHFPFGAAALHVIITPSNSSTQACHPLLWTHCPTVRGGSLCCTKVHR